MRTVIMKSVEVQCVHDRTDDGSRNRSSPLLQVFTDDDGDALTFYLMREGGGPLGVSDQLVPFSSTRLRAMQKKIEVCHAFLMSLRLTNGDSGKRRSHSQQGKGRKRI